MQRYFIAIFFIGVFAISISFCCKTSKEQSQNEPTYLNLHDSVEYVGIQTCRQCHDDKYQTFIKTGMGQSFDDAIPQKSSGKFNRHITVYDKYSDFYYKPYWDNYELMLMEFRLNGKDTTYKRLEKIDYIIGSGQHTNSHIININGYLYQVPITFYTQKEKWDLPPGFENGQNTRFERTIGIECISCHNALPELANESEKKFQKIPKGIDCERCHGPGEIHVKEKLAGNIINTQEAIDYSIVNPAKLAIDLQIDVCQRCHLQGNSVLKENKSFTDFKPGMKLSSVFDVFLPKFEGGNEDMIMASHAERMKMSKCFVESHNKQINNKLPLSKTNILSCITCHNPHKSVKVTDKEAFNDACKNCHTGSSSISHIQCTANEKELSGNENNCIKCHMTRSTTIDVPHVITTDHYIKKPVDSISQKKIKQFVGLVCLTDDHPFPLTIAKAYIGYFEKFSSNASWLDSAAYYLFKDKPGIKQETDYFNTFIHLAYLKNDFTRLIQFTKQYRKVIILDAWTNYRIGEAYYQTGSMKDACYYFNEAARISPYNLEFWNKTGSVLMDMGSIDEAKSVFNNILLENPKFKAAINNLGFIYYVNKEFKEAEILYNKALLLDPDYESALLNKAQLYFDLKRKADAIKILSQILQKNPDNIKVQQALKQMKKQNV